MDWLILVIVSLATFRITELIAKDSGPFKAFKRWRALWRGHELFSCIYCVSAYVSMTACLVLRLGGYVSPVNWLLYSGAVWGSAVVIFRVVRER